MRTRYFFSIETFVKRHDELHVRTSRAELALTPDADEKKNEELTNAAVLVNGPFSFDGILLARYELIKVLLRNAPKGARIVDRLGLMPDRYEEVPDNQEEAKKARIGNTLTLTGRRIVRYEHMHSEPLKINVDSDSPAVFCYYDSMRKTHSIDGFRELFKIIDYFSGVKEGSEKDTDRILASLGTKWWIPDHALQMAKALVKDDSLTESALARRLIDCRGRCSHMRPEYGLRPTDLLGLARLTEMSLVLDMIVRHSLERNPETAEPIKRQ